MDYIAQPKDYWIAQGAITITLNALGNPNRMQGSVVSGAAILCYIEGVDGLGYDNGHRFKTWPLSLSPTYFNSNTKKYVYAAIPRTATVGIVRGGRIVEKKKPTLPEHVVNIIKCVNPRCVTTTEPAVQMFHLVHSDRQEYRCDYCDEEAKF